MRSWTAAAAAALTIAGCGGPETFQETREGSSVTVDARGMAYDQAWNATVEVLSNHMDIDFISKPSGFIRTEWNYSWTGEIKSNYRVRVTVLYFNGQPGPTLKTEAYAGGHGSWVKGRDTKLIDTLRSELSAKFGGSAEAPKKEQ